MSTALTLILALVIGAAIWLARNDHRLSATAYRISVAARRRLATPLAAHGKGGGMLSARFFGNAALTALAVGVAALCGLAALFAKVSDNVVDGEGLALVDRPIVAWLAAHREPVLTTVMRTVTMVGSPVVVAAVITIVCTAVAWRTRSGLPLMIAVLALAGFVISVTVAKLVVGRQRPPLCYAVMALDGYSYPSGHTIGVTIAAGVCARILTHWVIRSDTIRIAVWTTAVVVIGGVGFSRVYLGVHYPSDVIGGWLLGGTWTGALIAYAALWQHARRTRGHSTTKPRRLPSRFFHRSVSGGLKMRYAKPLLVAACTAALLVPVGACSNPTAPPANPPLADSTRTNALSAMHGEALAHAKYLAYVTQAQEAGRAQAAQQFTSAAQTEHMDHFAREADLIGLGSDIAANLRDAISGETNEVNTMYPGFAKQATADNDPAAASAFSEIGADEATHLKDFKTALNAVNNPGSGAPVPAGTTPVPVGTTPVPVAITAGPPRSSGTTLANLRTAIQGEAFAYAKYMRYADQARRDGNPAVAQLFTNTANVELNEHFATLATLAGLVATDTNANLHEAINGEQHEADVMYPDYARQADQTGNPQAAKLFREIAGDEKTHQQMFQKALTAS